MTKLMTSVAALQCVESGKVQLDQDVRPLLPGIGKYGVITGFDDEKNTAVLKPEDTPITLRMLLCHTSGHEYGWLNPLLGKWRASLNEQPWLGPTVADKCTLPLVFAPGTGFAYGGGHDWAGKVCDSTELFAQIISFIGFSHLRCHCTLHSMEYLITSYRMYYLRSRQSYQNVVEGQELS